MSISIIIPSYEPDKEALEQTLISIRKQSIPEYMYEIVVIDNNSSRDLRSLVESYGGRMYKNKKTLGRVENWNECLNYARHCGRQCIKLIFVGDTLEEYCLEMQFVMTRKSCFVTSGHYVVGESTYAMLHANTYTLFSSEEVREKQLTSGNFLAGCVAAPLFTRELLRVQETIFDVGMEWAADWKFWAELTRNQNVSYIASPLVSMYMKFRKSYPILASKPQSKLEEEIVRDLIKTF